MINPYFLLRADAREGAQAVHHTHPCSSKLVNAPHSSARPPQQNRIVDGNLKITNYLKLVRVVAAKAARRTFLCLDPIEREPPRRYEKFDLLI